MNTNVISVNRIYEDCYDRQRRERELIVRSLGEMPTNLTAIMTARQAREYLGVSRTTMDRYQELGILPPIINPDNGYRYYLLSHLWVFKKIWLEADGD